MLSCRRQARMAMLRIPHPQQQHQQQQRSLSLWTTTTTSSGYSSILGSSSSYVSPWLSSSAQSNDNDNDDDYNNHNSNSNSNNNHHRVPPAATCTAFQYQQVRWKRKDGNRFHFMENNKSKTTKKQRKRYNRMLKKERLEREKHNPPGSRAAIHKQYLREFEKWAHEEKDDKKKYEWTPEELADYTMEDALLDNFMSDNNNARGGLAQPTPIPQYVGHLQQSLFNTVADQMEDYRLAIQRNEEIQQQLLLASGKEEDQKDSSSSSSSLPAEIQSSLLQEWTENVDDLLPTDLEISLALRAYRDKHGTRQQPIGLVRALSHLVKDLDVPMSTTLSSSSSTTPTPTPTHSTSLDDDTDDTMKKARGWGEYTYTTLLTCCQTPAEGRRVFTIMKQQQHPLSSSYCWNILMDLHAKCGDYEGCIQVQEEMMRQGIKPTVVSYTTILAACYKVCVDTSRIPHAVRSKAKDTAWLKWREMRIAGIEPDAMAYGALLRILAATGQPERALNVLEEMQYLLEEPVQPTTLCFTSALKAIAKSHATAIRFERGSSRRNLRREFLTAHHGKLAQKVVILAEQAGVVQDDGFIAALVSCAAAAGDVATAKSIYVAHQIRRECDFLRTIGPDEHLEQLNSRGSENVGGSHEEHDNNIHLEAGAATVTSSTMAHDDYPSVSVVDKQSSSSTNPAVVNGDDGPIEQRTRRKRRSHQDKVQLFQEREYGKDSRVVSSILHACATAASPNGMGTLWQGRENQGYLCINSLRLLTARRVPRYEDESIPGATRTSHLTWYGESKDEDYRDGKRAKGRASAKARAQVYVDENAGATMNELDDAFSRMFLDKDGKRKPQYQRLTFEDIWKLKYHRGDDDDDDEVEAALLQDGFLGDSSRNHNRRKKEHTRVLSSSSSSPSSSFEDPDDDKREELYFCKESMRWKTRPKALFEQVTPEVLGEDMSEKDLSFIDETTSVMSTDNKSGDAAVLSDEEEEMYFDQNLMRWSTRPKVVKQASPTTESPTTGAAHADTATSKQADEVLYFDTDEMKWKTRPRLESEMAGLNEFEAKMLDNDKRDSADDDERSIYSADEEAKFAAFYRDLTNEMQQSGEVIDSAIEEEARELFFALRDMGSENDDELSIEDNDEAASHDDSVDSALADAFSRSEMIAEQDPVDSTEEDLDTHDSDTSGKLATIDNTTEAFEVVGVDDHDHFEVDEELAQLRELLPAFSDKRLRKIQKAFHGSLNDPSLLDLSLIVRESMPDYITNTWLKQMSLLTAKYVVAKAAQDGLVDIHVLNNVLELEAAVGSLDRALEFHQTEYKKYQVTPNGFSDRLLVQMFLKHNRFQRALAFKEKVEKSSRSLDIPSYGSLVDYCARHNQLGSAITLLKECIDVHGSPPSEASLSQLRILCRQYDLVEELRLTKLIGKDPTEWLRHGEAHLKREMSKKGRRGVRFARDVLVQV